jgi:hypothetical protein
MEGDYYQVKMAAGEDGCTHCGAGEVTFTGKLVDVGNLSAGRGASLEADGEQVDLTGLTETETKELAKWLCGRVTVTIRCAADTEVKP